jgi:hypothetical protein
MKCPNCIDGGCYPAIPHPWFPLVCNICNGSGNLPENIVYDPVRGGQIKKLRHNLELTLKAYCFAMCVDVTQQSMWERGYFQKEDSDDSAARID